MKQIAAATFKKECLALIDHMDAEGLIITKDGKPVAKVVPVGPDSAAIAGSPEGRDKIAGQAAPGGQEWGC